MQRPDRLTNGQERPARTHSGKHGLVENMAEKPIVKNKTHSGK